MTLLAPSSHPALSHADRIAASSTDVLLLVGRVLLGWIFLISVQAKFANMPGFAGYLTSLKMPAPYFWAWVASIVELLCGIGLILGLATRYAAVLAIVFVAVATAVAHRYWEYPAAQQLNQFNHFLKNISIIGGSLLLFTTGAGRFSFDSWLARRG